MRQHDQPRSPLAVTTGVAFRMSAASDPTLEEQRRFWNSWDRQHIEHRDLNPQAVSAVAEAKAQVILSWIGDVGLPPGSSLLEVGCATGWLTERLTRWGSATGIDLADEVVTRSRERRTGLTLLSGDVMSHPFAAGSFDLIVTIDVLSHVPDQEAFVARLADLLKPGGHLLVLTQNRFVFERRSDVQPIAPGQIRHWLNRGELRALLGPRYAIRRLETILPEGHRGVLRLANSLKVSALAGALGLRRSLDRFRERVGLGQSIVALARRKD
jgi:2-polyprenyl-3-methyl-5-hydroxy-6-metoxy-1,4-benzoquinol methylase